MSELTDTQRKQVEAVRERLPLFDKELEKKYGLSIWKKTVAEAFDWITELQVQKCLNDPAIAIKDENQKLPQEIENEYLGALIVMSAEDMKDNFRRIIPPDENKLRSRP